MSDCRLAPRAFMCARAPVQFQRSFRDLLNEMACLTARAVASAALTMASAALSMASGLPTRNG